MVRVPQAPSFPPEGVTAKALELGFGSGPWSRGELATRWSDSTANRFISEAKSFGWLVSPFRDGFFVPPARDLAVVGWLPSFEREEFLVSRVLATLGVRCWCLSWWARAQGLLFPRPLFVTDLRSRPEAGEAAAMELGPPSASQVRRGITRRASSWGRLPFLENLLMVPAVPQTSRLARGVRAVLPMGFPQKPASAAWMLDEEEPPATDPASALRAIPYRLTPDVDDPAWVVALLFTLGLPRADEALERALRQAAGEDERLRRRSARKGRRAAPLARRVEQWAGLLAPPRPNEAWREAVERGPPFLLVPSALAEDVATGTWARRFGDLQKVKEWLDAQS